MLLKLGNYKKDSKKKIKRLKNVKVNIRFTFLSIIQIITVTKRWTIWHTKLWVEIKRNIFIIIERKNNFIRREIGWSRKITLSQIIRIRYMWLLFSD